MGKLIALGGRKFALGLIYLLGCFTISTIAVLKGLTGWNAAAVGSLFISIATGLGAVIWGNVATHRAENGNGKA